MSIKVQGGSGNLALVDSNGSLQVSQYQAPDDFIGFYNYHFGNLTVQASAHNGTSTGFFWLMNPANSGKVMLIERIRLTTQFTTNLSTPTAPRIIIQRFTWSGTPSGASSIPMRFDTSYAVSGMDLRTAATGLTVTLDTAGILWAGLPVSSQGTAGWATSTPSEQFYIPREEEYELIIRPGYGLVLWQADAGTTADTRKITGEISWEEATA